MTDLVHRLMNELVAYGGFAATRAEVYADIQERIPTAPRYGIGSPDWWAFSPPAITADQAALLIPWSDRPT